MLVILQRISHNLQRNAAFTDCIRRIIIGGVKQQTVKVSEGENKETADAETTVSTVSKPDNDSTKERTSELADVSAQNSSLKCSYPTHRKKKKVEPNRFRPIVYSEGELDKSDLSKPPSRANPHPFDPSANPTLLPSTHSWSIAHYVNHLPMLQVLVELGMDLFEVDSSTHIGSQLVKLDWNKDVRPKLVWLIHQVGMPINEIGSYLTRNPYFLLQNLENMQVRLNYLYSKRLNKENALKIVKNSRFWLNMDVKTIDGRLGWIQKTFELTGDEVRQLIIKEPKVIMYGVGPMENLVIMLTEDLEFTKNQIKTILLKDPRVYMMERSDLRKNYNYLHYIMKITNLQIVEWPLCLRCPVGAIRKRHEFLVKLQKADYNEGSPNYITLSALLQPSDQQFAVNVARTYLAVYNAFLKNY